MVCTFKVGLQSDIIPREERKTFDMFTVDKMLSPFVNIGYMNESCTRNDMMMLFAWEMVAI